MFVSKHQKWQNHGCVDELNELSISRAKNRERMMLFPLKMPKSGSYAAEKVAKCRYREVESALSNSERRKEVRKLSSKLEKKKSERRNKKEKSRVFLTSILRPSLPFAAVQDKGEKKRKGYFLLLESVIKVQRGEKYASAVLKYGVIASEYSPVCLESI